MNKTYDQLMKPIEKKGMSQIRQQIVAQASGKVLEIGAGTGANLSFYNFNQIDELIVTDVKLSPILLKKGNNKRVHYKQASAEALPFDDETFDTVLFTLVFCSVKDVSKGLSEVKRVLKKDGKILFIEHVLSDKQPLKWFMNTMNTPWKCIAHGCHLNRHFEQSLEQAGFRLEQSTYAFNHIGFYGCAIIN